MTQEELHSWGRSRRSPGMLFAAVEMKAGEPVQIVAEDVSLDPLLGHLSEKDSGGVETILLFTGDNPWEGFPPRYARLLMSCIQ